jgi:predicted metal-dependent peptidase
MDIDKLAAKRVLNARTELITARRFYGVLVSNVEPRISREVPRAATNGKTHFWNPDFIATLTQTQLLAVQAHEAEHDARRHHSRRGARDPERWNKAGDYVINFDLKAEGFDLPEWALYDERFAGMSVEDAYRVLELDEQRQQPQPQPQADDQDEGNEADDQDGDQGDEGDQDAGSSDQDDQGDGDEAGGHGDQGDQDGDQAGDSDGGKGGDQPGQEAAGKPNGAGAGDMPGEGGNTQPGQSGGQPWDMGSVLDAPADDPGQLGDSDLEWSRIVRMAATQAKRAGQLPGHITREIEAERKPKTDWREELRAWIDAGSKRIETWNRPNRRFAGRGLFLPGNQRDGINHIAVLVDTSGSMDAIALQCVANEVQGALDSGAIDRVTVVYGDTRVTRVDEYGETDQLEFDPRGGGGTQMSPLFEYVRDELQDVAGILCFTDLYWYGELPPEPDPRVLFAVTGYPDDVRRLIENAPWGASGIDVGGH